MTRALQTCGRTGAGQRGTSLLETCAALALAAAAAAALVSGVHPLSCALRVDAGRNVLIGAMLEARREAYAAGITTTVEASEGGDRVTLQPSGRIQSLGEGVTLVSVPADGNVQFRAAGLADNATLVVACGDAEAKVVVNQRGVIR